MQTIILDTQIFIYWISNPKLLKKEHYQLIKNTENSIEISICSLYEISIKKSIGKLIFEQDYAKVLKNNYFKLIPINYDHLSIFEKIPLLHKDPFDRMIIAQAIAENKKILSYDEVFAQYDVSIIQ